MLWQFVFVRTPCQFLWAVAPRTFRFFEKTAARFALPCLKGDALSRDRDLRTTIQQRPQHRAAPGQELNAHLAQRETKQWLHILLSQKNSKNIQKQWVLRALRTNSCRGFFSPRRGESGSKTERSPPGMSSKATEPPSRSSFLALGCLRKPSCFFLVLYDGWASFALPLLSLGFQDLPSMNVNIICLTAEPPLLLQKNGRIHSWTMASASSEAGPYMDTSM